MIEQKVADTILDEPVQITVPVRVHQPKNIFQKLLRKIKKKPQKFRVFEITGATLSTMLKVCRLRLQISQEAMPVDAPLLDYIYERVDKEAHLHAEIIATAIHNQPGEVPKELVKFIFENFTATDIKSVSDTVTGYLNLVDFMNTTTSIRTINLLEVGPKEPQE